MRSNQNSHSGVASLHLVLVAVWYRAQPRRYEYPLPTSTLAKHSPRSSGFPPVSATAAIISGCQIPQRAAAELHVTDATQAMAMDAVITHPKHLAKSSSTGASASNPDERPRSTDNTALAGEPPEELSGSNASIPNITTGKYGNTLIAGYAGPISATELARSTFTFRATKTLPCSPVSHTGTFPRRVRPSEHFVRDER